MDITQKFKVEFMVTAVLPSDAEETIAQDLVKLAKAVMNGDCFKFSPASVRKVS